MQGSAFIVHSKGWACSNSVALNIHTESIRDPAGKIQSLKKSQVLIMDNYFDGEGKLEPDEAVEIVLRPDEAEQLLSFTGRVKSATHINIFIQTEEVHNILKKIGGN